MKSRAEARAVRALVEAVGERVGVGSLLIQVRHSPAAGYYLAVADELSEETVELGSIEGAADFVVEWVRTQTHSTSQDTTKPHPSPSTPAPTPIGEPPWPAYLAGDEEALERIRAYRLADLPGTALAHVAIQQRYHQSQDDIAATHRDEAFRREHSLPALAYYQALWDAIAAEQQADEEAPPPWTALPPLSHEAMGLWAADLAEIHGAAEARAIIRRLGADPCAMDLHDWAPAFFVLPDGRLGENVCRACGERREPA